MLFGGNGDERLNDLEDIGNRVLIEIVCQYYVEPLRTIWYWTLGGRARCVEQAKVAQQCLADICGAFAQNFAQVDCKQP